MTAPDLAASAVRGPTARVPAPPPAPQAGAEAGPAAGNQAGQLGMWIFLGTELLFFGGLLLAYAYGRTHWPHGFAVAGRQTDVVLGTVNTGLLLTSSALMALALACADHLAHRRWTGRLLWLTAATGAAFLAIKGIEYRHEWNAQLFPRAGFALSQTDGAALFFWLYFVTTGLHALHLLIGITGVSTLAWGHGRARPWAALHQLEAMGLYWHFVDVVWIFLYPLLYLVGRHP